MAPHPSDLWPPQGGLRTHHALFWPPPQFVSERLLRGPLFYFRLAHRSVKPAPRMEQCTDEQLHTHTHGMRQGTAGHSRTQRHPGPLRASRSREARRRGQAPPRPRCQAPGQGADPRARARRPLCAHGPSPRCMAARPRPRARGHAGRAQRNDGGVAGSTTDFASAAARLPQHPDLLLEEGGAPPRTQVGRAQHPGLRPRLRARLRGPRPGGGARAGPETELARQALRGQHGGARRARALP